MITVDTFFSGTLNTVDAVIGNFVEQAYAHFVQANSGVITLLFTVYVMFLGYEFINHNHHFNLSVIFRRIIVMLCVYGLVMNWSLYHLFVYNIFTTEPGNVAQILVNATGKFHLAENITQTLDGIYAAVNNAARGFFSQLNFSAAGVAFFFYGVLVYLIGVTLCVFALLLFVYAKMMMAISLALGPIFILFILWEPTKGMFSAWLNKLITIALIPIVTSAILVLMLSVIHVTLPNITQQPENLQFYGIAPFLGLSLTTTLILSQVFRICSTLGGGITLASLSHGTAIAASALQNSGVTPMARMAGNWAKQKATQAKRRLSRGKS